MRCYICDAHLSEHEMNFNDDHKRYDPCSSCMDKSFLGEGKFRHGTTLDVLLDEMFDTIDPNELQDLTVSNE